MQVLVLSFVKNIGIRRAISFGNPEELDIGQMIKYVYCVYLSHLYINRKSKNSLSYCPQIVFVKHILQKSPIEGQNHKISGNGLNLSKPV